MAKNSEASQNALENPLILQHIFRNLSSPDLLDCRLVNRLNWFDLATEILCEKKETKIELNFSSKLTSGQFSPAFENPSENPWSCKSLMKILKQSRVFPCSRFRFSGMYFDNEDLLEFFSVNGDFVIELELNLIARTNVNNVIEKFGEILWKRLPNLEKLTIWNVSLSWSSSTRLFSKKLRPIAKLEKLKYLNFEESVGSGEFKFIQDIQNAAPNLQQQNVQEIPFVYPKREKGWNLIGCNNNGLRFSPEKSNMSFYERILRTKAKFSKIDFDLEKVRNRPEILSRVRQMLTEILYLSQPTLQRIDGVVEILSVAKIQLGQFKFPWVEQLTLANPVKSCPEENHNNDKDDENLISSAVLNLDLDPKSMWKIAPSFPALSSIRLDSLDVLQNLQETFQSVKILTCSVSFSSAGEFQKLGKIFPMLEKLELENVKNFQECSHALWENFGKLTNLVINISVENPNPNPNPSSQDVSMDKAFLGLSVQKQTDTDCANLENSKVFLEKMSTNSSILKLAELKSLRVTFTPTLKKLGSGSGSANGLRNWNHWNFLRKSTVELASKEMKQLNSIDLVVDAKNTNCRDKEEIRKQLDDFQPFARLKIYL